MPPAAPPGEGEKGVIDLINIQRTCFTQRLKKEFYLAKAPKA